MNVSLAMNTTWLDWTKPNYDSWTSSSKAPQSAPCQYFSTKCLQKWSKKGLPWLLSGFLEFWNLVTILNLVNTVLICERKYMLSTILRCKTHRTSCILLLVVIRPTLLNILSFLQQVFLIPDYWLNFDVKQEMEEKLIWNKFVLPFFWLNTGWFF